MKIKVFFICALLFLVQPCYSQSSVERTRDAYIQNLIKELVDEIHINQVAIDDSFSEVSFDAYLKKLDYGKRFFIQSDIDTLSHYRHLLDDQLKEGKFDFFNLSQELILKRIKEAEDYYKNPLKKPFDFDKEEYIQLNVDSISWEKNKETLEKRWYQMMKYETLVRVHSDIEAQKKAKEESDTVKEKSFAEIEAKARETVLKKYNNWYDYVSQWEHDDLFSYYINALLTKYDPHTEYFPPKEKEDFDIRFSGQLQGIGATLSQRDGYITVVDIIPGSPSWRQGDLEVDDKILKVAQGAEEPVDIVEMRLDKAVKLIRGPKGTEVRLTIQKIDGTQKTIKIVRDLVVIAETYAKTMIITDNETDKRFGYIYLPSFYANFNDARGRRCSKDMAEAVEKLKDENVEGIILDLRNNTGGSLMDCIDIAGLFIETGPIVQVKSSNIVRVYNDHDADILWDGPLVVMINQSSASASEIFAAAMQDYKRAIVMGTNSFGKGSVQRFEDLDRKVQGMNDIKPLGALKITLQKFYRVNGGSTQLKGVAPDIPVTTMYKYIDYGERELEHPLDWSEIKATKYDIWKNDACDWETIKNNSLERMSKNPFFIKMDENAKRLKKNRDKSLYPLKYKNYASYIDKADKEAEKFKDLGTDTLDIEAVILTVNEDDNNEESDTTAIERNNKWIKQIITDDILYEALKVCNDVLHLDCFRKPED